MKMRFARCAAPVAIVLVLGASEASALTLVPPRDLAELAGDARAVVLASAGASSSSLVGGLPYTTTQFTVIEVVSGPLRPLEEFEVAAPGGEADGMVWAVAGSPRFEPGEEYLLFLGQSVSGTWTPRLLSRGTLRTIAAQDGTPLLAPLDTEPSFEVDRRDAAQAEELGVYVRSALLEQLTAVLSRGEPWDPSRASARQEMLPAEGEGGVAPAICAFITDGRTRFRWQVFDTQGTATMYADATGDPSLPNGPFRIVQESMNLWTAIPGLSLNLTFGGARQAAPQCNDGGTAANTIVFNDPCDAIDDLVDCRGVLAFGGPLGGTSTHTFDGARWLTANGWAIVVTSGAGSLGESNYRLMLAHEMGHGLGFGHVSDANALMFANCCNNVAATDRTCALYTYPVRNPNNRRPVVNAGEDLTLTLAGDTLQLAGRATDDGLPTAPGAITTTWRVLVGPPAGARFADRLSPATAVTFGSSGTFLLGLTAFDGELAQTDVIEITVRIHAGSEGSATFRQRTRGYRSTHDTFLQESTPVANNSRAAELSSDLDDPSGSGQENEVLLRFDDIFGPDADQIPPGASILSATLRLWTTNDGNGARIFRMNQEWEDTEGWDGFGGDGVQAGREAFAAADTTVTGSAQTVDADVKTSLAAWSKNPCDNHGWVFLSQGSDGWDFYSAEGTEPPLLSVVYSRTGSLNEIAAGSDWLYWKGTAEPPAGWTDAGFQPGASWLSGRAGIGYGDGDDATVLSDMQNSYLSIFCRREFERSAGEADQDLALTVIHDDGVVAYVNGVEVGRANMPAGAINRSTRAQASIEAQGTTFAIASSLLHTGTNVVAVSIHNADLSSSDLSFDAVLATAGAAGTISCTSRFQRGDVNGSGTINITDVVNLLDALFLGGTAPACLDAADTDDNGRLVLTDAVFLLNHLFQGGPAPPAPGKDCGPDPTVDDLEDCSTVNCDE